MIKLVITTVAVNFSVLELCAKQFQFIMHSVWPMIVFLRGSLPICWRLRQMHIWRRNLCLVTFKSFWPLWIRWSSFFALWLDAMPHVFFQSDTTSYNNVRLHDSFNLAEKICVLVLHPISASCEYISLSYWCAHKSTILQFWKKGWEAMGIILSWRSSFLVVKRETLFRFTRMLFQCAIWYVYQWRPGRLNVVNVCIEPGPCYDFDAV